MFLLLKNTRWQRCTGKNRWLMSKLKNIELKLGTSHHTNTKVQCLNRVAERGSNKARSRQTSSSHHDRSTPIFINQDAADRTWRSKKAKKIAWTHITSWKLVISTQSSIHSSIFNHQRAPVPQLWLSEIKQLLQSFLSVLHCSRCVLMPLIMRSVRKTMKAVMK